MTLLALTLVLAAAVCHATWNFLVKRINGGPELVWLFSLLAALIYLPLAVAVYVIEQPVMGWREIAVCMVSAFLHLGYFLLLQQGYRHGDLSLVYPTARATGPFLSTIFAVVFLGEIVTLQVLAGAAVIIVGVIFLTGGFRSGARHLTSSLLFGLGAGFLIGSYTVWDAYAVQKLLIPFLLLDYTSSLVRAVFLAPYALRHKALVRGHWQRHRVAVLGIAVFNPLAYILVLAALTFTPVVYIAPAREVSVLITVLMGTLLLGEGILKQRLFWAAFIFIGMTLLATG